MLSESDFAVGVEARYFEDYLAGAVYEYGYAGVSEAEIIAFAERFDPQPIHVDAQFAGHGPFGGLIASGWHTAGIAMRLIVTHYLSQVASLASPGWTNCAGPHRCGPATRCDCGPRSSRPGAPAPSQTAAWCGPRRSCSTSTTRPRSAWWP